MLALTLLVSVIPFAADARGGGPRGGGFSRPSGGGFDFGGSGGSRSSTGPAGTQRTTNVSNTGGTYGRTTTATNQGTTRTTNASAGGGNYNKGSTTTTPYGSHATSTNANATTGNYNRSSSGSNANGSYSANTSGNVYNRTATHTTSATNAYGQTYTGYAASHNGYVVHGAAVTNPVYARYPVWGWNAGVAWAPVPYYWGGGFWGPYAVGAATAALWGTYLLPNNVTVQSYQVEPDSAGAKLLASYQLTQTPCGPPDLVVIMGPNNSVICAKPNDTVAAGTYVVNEQTLTLASASK